MKRFSFLDERPKLNIYIYFFFQAEDGIRDVERSRGLGDVYKRQEINCSFLVQGFEAVNINIS